MSFFSRLSIKSKLMLLALGILTPVIGGGIYSLLQVSNFSENLLQDSYAKNAKALNSSIATLFFERYGDVQAFALNQAVISMNENTMTEYLDHYVSLYGIYDLILVVDKHGNFIASNTKDVSGKEVNKAALRGHSYANTPWFQAAISKQFTEDSSKGFVGTFVEDFMYDSLQKAAFGEDRTASSFTTVIKNKQDEVIGIITNRAGSRWFEGEMIKLYENLKSQGLISTEITLLNKDGFILSEYDPFIKGGSRDVIHDPNVTMQVNLFSLGHKVASHLRDQKAGSMIAEHMRKKIVQITGFDFNNDPKFISSLGWSVMVRESKDVALASQAKILNNTYLIYLLIGLLSLFGAMWFANNLSRGIVRITDEVSLASSTVANASADLLKSSNGLSGTAREQATSTEEASASLAEISEMINVSSTSAENANKITLQVKQFTEETQSSVSNLANAMSEILDSNNRIEKLEKILPHRLQVLFKNNCWLLASSCYWTFS